MKHQLPLTPAAEKLAAKIQELVEAGELTSISITIKGWETTEIAKIIKDLGIKEFSVTSIFGI